MTTEDIAVRLAEHGKEIGSLKHRMEDAEHKQDAIMALSTSVERMAVSMQSMADEQTRQRQTLDKQAVKIEAIEQEPVRNLKQYKAAIITGIITLVVSGIGSAILALILK